MYSCVGVAYMVLAGVGDSRLDLKMVSSLKLHLPSWGDAPLRRTGAQRDRRGSRSHDPHCSALTENSDSSACQALRDVIDSKACEEDTNRREAAMQRLDADHPGEDKENGLAVEEEKEESLGPQKDRGRRLWDAVA
ncbi:unnamed protein product [Boreogadus saida]